MPLPDGFTGYPDSSRCWKNFAQFLPQTNKTVVLSVAASSKSVNEDLYRKVKASAFRNADSSGSVYAGSCSQRYCIFLNNFHAMRDSNSKHGFRMERMTVPAMSFANNGNA